MTQFSEGRGRAPIRRLSSRALFFEHEGTRAVRDGRYNLTALRGDSWKLSLARKWDSWAISDFLIANFGTDCLEIVADGVHCTNEIRLDAKEEFR